MATPKKKLDFRFEHTFILWSLFLLFAVILIRTAWVSDDAFISIRTIENFLHGYGLTYNVGERVQGYTHPLWLLLLAGFQYLAHNILGISISGQYYFTCLSLSILFSFGTIYCLLFKFTKHQLIVIPGILILLFSKSFMDYSTSGLENALTHFLLVVFYFSFFSITSSDQEVTNRAYLLFFLLGSGILLTRLDNVFLILPSLVYSLFQKGKPQGRWKIALAGFSPLLVWLIFSIIYYGVFLPNTAFAKLNTQIPIFMLVKQGIFYLLNSLSLDPITGFIILIALSLGVIYRSKRDLQTLSVQIGLTFYILYVIRIGGDYMSGRFLSAPLLLAVIIFIKQNIDWSKLLVPSIVVIVMIGLYAPYPTITSNAETGANRDLFDLIDHKGIIDERAWYYPATGLLRALSTESDHYLVFPTEITDYQGKVAVYQLPEEKIDIADASAFERGFYDFPDSPWSMKRWMYSSQGQVVSVQHAIGISGYQAGPNVYILDINALVDPLLSKLPVADPKHWRIGHFQRRLPDGYQETLTTGQNVISDPFLARYYDKLSSITRGKIFTWERFQTIWNFNTGQYSPLIDQYIRSQTSGE